MFENVYLDVGLAINYTGARSEAIIAESLELAPFHKILFSSDAWGLSELTYMGAAMFRYGFGRVLAEWVDQGLWSLTDAKHVTDSIGYANAKLAYELN
jgi:predicted TIM-barrel fold metal-dependent hydrolase